MAPGLPCPARALLVCSVAWFADVSAQDTGCELMILQVADDLEALCCATSGTCDQDGTPSTCALRCAQKWLPVADQCSDFIAENFADMERFTESCRATCDGGHCGGSGFAPSPPADITFLDVTLALSGAYSNPADRQAFEAGLQDDIANAVHALEVDVLIVSSTPDSVVLEIFSLSADTCHAYSKSLGSQVSDANSALAMGQYSRAIVQNQVAQPTIETVQSGQTSGNRECFSAMHTTASFSNPMWQASGACCEAGDKMCNTPIGLRSDKDEMCYIPQGCTAECAALWLPFTNECGSFFDDIIKNEGDGKCGSSRVEAWDAFHNECKAAAAPAMKRITPDSKAPKLDELPPFEHRMKCDFGGTCGTSGDGWTSG